MKEFLDHMHYADARRAFENIFAEQLNYMQSFMRDNGYSEAQIKDRTYDLMTDLIIFQLEDGGQPSLNMLQTKVRLMAIIAVLQMREVLEYEVSGLSEMGRATR